LGACFRNLLCRSTARSAARQPQCDSKFFFGSSDLRIFDVAVGACGSTVKIANLAQYLSGPVDRFRQVVLVQLNPHEIQTELGGGDGGASEAKKRIHRQLHA
jgi:hypothetical protein